MELILKYFPELSSRQMEQFAALDELYRDWNTRINVISRKDIDHLYEKHVLHSLSIAKAFRFASGISLLDIGTGGGFPGIPLAIFFPEAQFHLVDSIGKKIKVVNEIKDHLRLQNITTAHARVEQIKHRSFDFAVTRAVAPLSKLISWSQPLIKKRKAPSGKQGLICLKGGDLSKEIADINYHPRIYDIHHFFPEKYFEEKYLLHIVW